jgi:hypothetical protein
MSVPIVGEVTYHPRGGNTVLSTEKAPTAKKTTAAKKAAAPKKAAAVKKAAAPKKAAAVKKAAPVAVPHENIAVRAYFISLEGGDDAFQNWLQAEQEMLVA